MSAIEILEASKLTIGRALLGLRGEMPGSVKQQVHDGDTISVRAAGNLGVRFLGIDAPEISFRLPGDRRFRSLGDPQWEEFLRDPFAARWEPFDDSLSEGLKKHLQGRIADGGAAGNQHRLAKAAEEALETEVLRDMQVMGKDAAKFRFFIAFAYEVMDGYGRLLGYINREQPNPNEPAPRPLTYNERLLQQGRVVPYFIWPNVNPWRKQDSILKAVVAPGTARTEADQDTTLRRAREWVQECRRKHLGVFDAMDPLRLEPFELRLLARRSVPARWVIDLSSNDNQLVHPQRYYTIPNPEDRLFIPEEFVPLFVEHGWKRQPAAG